MSFPSDPYIGQIYTIGTTKYSWNGNIWDDGVEYFSQEAFDSSDPSQRLKLLAVADPSNPGYGTLSVTGGVGGGGGSSGDASAANQLIANTKLTSIDNKLLSTFNGATSIGNQQKEFIDVFTYNGIDPAKWDVTTSNASGSSIAKGGDFARISMAMNSDFTDIELLSKEVFKPPFNVAFAMSMATKFPSQLFSISVVSCDVNGNLITQTAPADIPITGAVSISGGLLLVGFTTPHGFTGNERVDVLNCASSIINLTGGVVSVIDRFNISINPQFAIGFPVASVTTGGAGVIRLQDPLRRGSTVVSEGAGILYDGQAGAFSTPFHGRNFKSRTVRNSLNINVAGTGAGPFSEDFLPSTITEINVTKNEVILSSRSTEDVLIAPALTKLAYKNFGNSSYFKLRIHGRSSNNVCRPIAKISSISKAGTTTATIVTDVPHNLTTDSWVGLIGTDNTTFFNSVYSQVTSVVNSTTFTTVTSGAPTASASGGAVLLVTNGGGGLPTYSSAIITGVSCVTPGELRITLNQAFDMSIGELVDLFGMVGAPTKDGAYRIGNVDGTGTIVDLIAPAETSTFGNIATAGAIFKRLEVRLHFVKIEEFSNHVVSLKPNQDAAKAIPVQIKGDAGNIVSDLAFNPLYTGIMGGVVRDIRTGLTNSFARTLQLSTEGSLFTQQGLAVYKAEVTSITRTSTGNTGVTSHATGGSITGLISVTAVGGTTKFLDLTLEESYDNGTTFHQVWAAPRISATGTTPIPPMLMHGRRRWVYTITGTGSPSFTFNISTCSAAGAPLNRTLIDRAITPNTLNSASAWLNIEGIKQISLLVASGAGATGSPVYAIDVSDDQTVFATLPGSSLTLPASSTLTTAGIAVCARWARIRITTAGVASVHTYATIRGTS